MLKTLFAALCVIGIALAEHSPVFLWGANSTPKSALHTVRSNEFAELITPLLEDHMVVAFQEENLSNYDFSCANAETPQSCHAYLQGVSEKTYYTNVENPAEALRSVAKELEFNSVGKSGKLELPVTCSPGKIVFVNFDSSKGKRSDVLDSHDAAISSVTKELSCPVVYLYMSAPSNSLTTKSRVRRRTAALADGEVFRQGAQFLLFFTNITYVDESAKKTKLDVSGMTVTNMSETQFSVKLAAAGDHELSFLITHAQSYFIMSNVTYGGSRFHSTGVNAPTTFSYYCGDLTLHAVGELGKPDKSKLIWKSLQLQAPFGRISNPEFAFGDPWYCVGFFSPPILAGLFVVILLLSITFTAICWMMDINTMDRFDDPKGKTITVNAGE